MRRIEYLHGHWRAYAELLALGYIAIIAAIASGTGAVYVLFPELGALSHDVFSRPRGSWARAPLLLVITPVATAAIGTLITRNLPYGYLSVMLTVGGAIIMIAALQSPVAPAISAALLPLVLGVRSWWYPPAIVLGTIILAASSLLWQRMCLDLHQTAGISEDEDSGPAATPLWPIAALMLFVVFAVFIVNRTNLRFILFPPLVVIGFEMFVHTERCPWANHPLRLPLACLFAAAGGLLSRHFLGIGPLASIASMGWGIAMLRAFDVHVPPALAVALLPQVMESPTMLYPLSVGIGTSLLSGSFIVYQKLRSR
jgi:hypothetical protein